MTGVINQEITDQYSIYHADCVELVREIPDNSIDFMVYSPPFKSLFCYSNSERDMGNCATDEEFYTQYAFLVKELYRALKPGRILAFHCMNLPTSKERDGFIGISDFRGDLIRLHQKEGFIYHSEVVIWKDPVTAMQRTKAIGLLHKQIKKDSCLSRQGIPDYLVSMRKPGENKEPVAGELTEFYGEEEIPLEKPSELIKTDATWSETEDAGEGFIDVGELADRLVDADKKAITRRSINIWQRYASPVWFDINQSDTLQRTSAREAADERHVCPLQLGVIRRAIQLWTNPGDVVLTPFMGIGSEVYTAIKMERRGIGVELKESYYNQSVLNCRRAVIESGQTNLLAGMGMDDEPEDNAMPLLSEEEERALEPGWA